MNNVVDADVQGIPPFDAIARRQDGAPVTVREADRLWRIDGAPVRRRTPADVRTRVEQYIDEGGCNGFMLLATTHRVLRRCRRTSRTRCSVVADTGPYPGTTLPTVSGVLTGEPVNVVESLCTASALPWVGIHSAYCPGRVPLLSPQVLESVGVSGIQSVGETTGVWVALHAAAYSACASTAGSVSHST